MRIFGPVYGACVALRLYLSE